ncbi:MAG: hypothetical protein NTW21_37445, partial [Verrucomicrobia bacterium]|nr:hypothetical protein [Verrucomicrobiota bacterium]
MKNNQLLTGPLDRLQFSRERLSRVSVKPPFWSLGGLAERRSGARGAASGRILPILVMLAALLAALLAPAAHAQAPTVGDTGPGGGIVFYVDANIYLEAAPSNWGSETTNRQYATGGNATTTVPGGATGTAIGTGYANSVAIANQTGNVAATCAAVAAREYTGGGLTDW